MPPKTEWRHVPTRFNPADLNSRGVDAAELIQSELWISGPKWLRQSEENWPKSPVSLETEEEEYRCLKKRKGIPATSPLKSLNPILGDKEVLRVGGRLENATLAWETKHPIILPKHHVSNMIIRQCHVDTLHGGLQLTMYTVRQKFWIIGCRNAARTVIHQCIRCVRWQANTSTQIMQDLIPERSRAARPFSNCGVDYAGPYRVRDSAGRGETAHKAYIAVFICFATRAVHIELVHDYTTSAFLAALDRFIARRGVPSCMFSDNGTNFVGADRELKEHFNTVYQTPEMRTKCGQKGIKWRFNSLSAPHFGGMQEAGVKSVKHHLKRIIGEFTPTSEEMQTLLCKFEASLNSRPIAALSDCPEDYVPLTPGHFLIGGPMNALPVDANPSSPPNQWEMGRIEEVLPGRDRCVRRS
ncbi:uncharacterized protein LOC122404383 [Colletes gigas]|uniref:uncharacterized protein LOC122404383 n=1 Tax=Colletes gigas TaxID=935657 RepID=UPI001C9BAD8C|nr:uncharacterized protein LOC122404383 [Colletes gigas]